MSEPCSWDVAVERGLIDLREPFHTVQTELLDLLGVLAREAWSAPTILPGWDVHSVALHLLGGDIGRLSGAWSAADAGSVPDFTTLAARIESSNEDWVQAVRRVPPPLLVDMLRLTADRVSALYAKADLWAPATPVAWTGTGPSPLWLDLAREYTERWVHQAQIREAVGAPLLDDRRWLWALLDVFMLCLPRALSAVEARPGTALQIVVSGHAGGSWRVARAADRWHLDTARWSGPVAASIQIPVDLAWRWLAGLVPSSSVEASASVQGDPAVWRPALRAVAVMTTAR